MEKVLPAEPVLSLLLAVLSTSDCTCKTRALLLKCKTDLQTRSYIEELISHLSNSFSGNDVPLHTNCLLFQVRNSEAAGVSVKGRRRQNGGEMQSLKADEWLYSVINF